MQASQGEQRKSSAAEPLPTADTSPGEAAEVPSTFSPGSEGWLALAHAHTISVASTIALMPGRHTGLCASAGGQGGTRKCGRSRSCSADGRGRHGSKPCVHRPVLPAICVQARRCTASACCRQEASQGGGGAAMPPESLLRQRDSIQEQSSLETFSKLACRSDAPLLS